MIPKFALRNNTYRVVARFYNGGSSQKQGKGIPATSHSPSPAQVNAEVPGLSSACIHQSSQPVGPGVDPNKSGAYKVPEYFCYDSTTYFEAEVEMSKFRCPQPSALKK